MSRIASRPKSSTWAAAGMRSSGGTSRRAARKALSNTARLSAESASLIPAVFTASKWAVTTERSAVVAFAASAWSSVRYREVEDDVAALAPPPTQQPAPRRGPHAHERPRTQTQADATDRAASTERPHQHTTQSAPRAVRWCRRAGPFETDTRARAGLSVPAPSPSVPHAPQPPSLMVRESAQK